MIVEEERWAYSGSLPCIWLTGQDYKDLGCCYWSMPNDIGKCEFSTYTFHVRMYVVEIIGDCT